MFCVSVCLLEDVEGVVLLRGGVATAIVVNSTRTEEILASHHRG